LDVSAVTAEMTIEELLTLFPQASGFFLRYGIRCFSCSGVIWGTVGEVLSRKGVEDVEATVSELCSYIVENAEGDSSQNS
jgi:hypothetical protein